MMLATEPVMVRLPASVLAMESTSQPVCGFANRGTRPNLRFGPIHEKHLEYARTFLTDERHFDVPQPRLRFEDALFAVSSHDYKSKNY